MSSVIENLSGSLLFKDKIVTINQKETLRKNVFKIFVGNTDKCFTSI